LIHGEEPQGTSSRRIMLKKEAMEIFANPQSMILKKSSMVKIFKLKSFILYSLLILSIDNAVLSRGMQC
jgi:hypothetical protein